MDQTLKTTSPARRTMSMPPPRLAVSLLFLMNGFIVGSWAPKIPELKERLAISEFTLGLLILVFGVGSLILMPVTGAFISRYGSRSLVRITSVIACPMLLMMTLVPNLGLACIAMFFFGGFVGAMDVAMNSNSVAVEKSMRRAIMSSCHGFWSLGGVLGAATGGVLLAHFGALVHAVFVTIACAAMVALAWNKLFADAPHSDVTHEKLRLPLNPLPWIIGMMALFSMIPEGLVLDWGALYLRNELGASVAVSSFAFAAFSATMAIMRFAGDLVRDRFGAVRTLRVSAVFALIGLTLAGLAPNAGFAVAGFALAGLGIANIVPIIFSAGGNIPGLAPGIGVSVATFMGYSGLLFAPSTIGFVAEHTGLAVVFSAVPVLLLIVLVLSHHARHADFSPQE